MDLMVSTVTKEVQVDEILSLPAKVEMWAMDLVDALEADYKKKYPNSHKDMKFRVLTGRKYLKINQYDVDIDGTEYGGGVHAFIDKNTGEVYKPASWKSPAKHVRYDLRIIREREECLMRADWAGGYLYMR
tara:strand:+ start:266 stop:658 length:393 start_codon:yes stop_codon:yes gene_type:complete